MTDNAPVDEEFTPRQRVEWRNDTGGDISHGTLIELDDGLGGPWWLVDVDGEDRHSLVKVYALYPDGGIRREQMADAIHRVMVAVARREGEPRFPAWSDALAAADAVIALDGDDK